MNEKVTITSTLEGMKEGESIEYKMSRPQDSETIKVLCCRVAKRQGCRFTTSTDWGGMRINIRKMSGKEERS